MNLNSPLIFDELTLRNFLSYGNNFTTVNLNRPGTTLIIGEDRDSGTGVSNGAGKTTLLNGLVYALFDRPLSKDIKLDELINNVNKKNLHVGLKFSKGGNHYEIIRQRKGKDGNTVKLFINDELKTLDSIDATNKFISEKILGYSYDVFVRIVVFSANHEPFFSLPTSGSSTKTTQTDIIEELFSLTILTEKAAKAKAEIKENEQKIELNKAKIEHAEKERARHDTQLTSIQGRLDNWEIAYAAKIEKAQEIISNLGDVDFEAELANWTAMTEIKAQINQIIQARQRVTDWQSSHDRKLLSVIRDRNTLLGIDFEAEIRMHNEREELLKQEDGLNSALIRTRTWELTHSEKVEGLEREFEQLSKIDFDAQFALFANIDSLGHAINDTRAKLHTLSRNQDEIQGVINKNHAELLSLAEAKCPYCLQEFHAATEKMGELDGIIKQALVDIGEVIIKVTLAESAIEGYKKELEESEGQLVVSHISDLNRKATAFETVKGRLEDARAETNPHAETLTNILGYTSEAVVDDALAKVAELGKRISVLKPSTPDVRTATRMQSEFVSLTTRMEELQHEVNPNLDELNDLLTQQATADTVEAVTKTDIELLEVGYNQMEAKVVTPDLKSAMRAEQEYTTAKERLEELKLETNPFVSTYEELKAMEIEDADYDEINKLKKIVDHQKLLVKLLTKSDSFVRKALIDKNIPLLNDQLRIYLKELGLSHKVEFTNTMTASITQMGRPLSYNNLSTGQKARVNLALSWAFRDVLQKMHSGVNFCLLDEVLDVGLCPTGITAAAKMLKSKAKADKLTMFIISHRDELNSTFERNMKVVFQKGFSRIEDE